MDLQRVFAALAATGLALAGAACAVVHPGKLAPGSSVASVRQAMGPPTGEHALADGSRLEYATGPFGRSTWMLDFDRAGSLRSATQVLTEANFNRVLAGTSQQELRSTLGRPADIWRLERQKQNVWVYRFDTPFCILFQVGVGDDGRVVDTGYTPDPLCEPKEFADRRR
jgi:hypothetical protein